MTDLVIGTCSCVMNWIQGQHVLSHHTLTLYSMFHTLDPQLFPSHMVTLQTKEYLEIS